MQVDSSGQSSDPNPPSLRRSQCPNLGTQRPGTRLGEDLRNLRQGPILEKAAKEVGGCLHQGQQIFLEHLAPKIAFFRLGEIDPLIGENIIV